MDQSRSSSSSHDSHALSTSPIIADRDRERARLMGSSTPISNNSSISNGNNGGGGGGGNGLVTTAIAGEILERPMPPFMSSSGSATGSYTNLSSTSSSRTRPTPTTIPERLMNNASPEHKLVSTNSSVSLSVNYLPSKFSSTMLNPGTTRRRHRIGRKGDGGLKVMKMGGGVDAFRNGESRMPVDGDDDYDGVNLKGGRWFMGAKGMKKMKWNKFKWALFCANIVLSTYSLVSLIVCLLTWFDVWAKADIVRAGNHPELVLSTIAASFGVFTSLVGWAGILLNNRSFLAIYTLFLWITFAFLVAPGYITYKRHTFNLEGKINSQWSRDLGPLGRLRVQNHLNCCGYFSPFIEATVSQTCYSRSVLPGCKLRYWQFEKMVLRTWYTIVFVLVPVHIGIIVAALLCSNHVTYRFGKGMMPKAYRLSMGSMAVIMDKYAGQLAEQYGNDVASEVLATSRSNMQFDTFPTMGYSGSMTPSVQTAGKYDSIGTKVE